MKTFSRRFLLPAAICLVLGILRAVDLALFTDPQTGFVTDNAVVLRYLVPLAAAVLLWLTGRGGPDGRTVPGRGLSAGLAVSGLLLAAAGAASLPSLTDTLLYLLAGLGLIGLAVVAARPREVPPSVLWFLPGVAGMLWVLIQRFSVVPASVVRLGCTFRVLSAAAALLLLQSLLKGLLLPDRPAGRAWFRYGWMALLFCTLHELPQAVFELVCGAVTLPQLLVSAGLGVFGLCGLSAALAASRCGADAVEK